MDKDWFYTSAHFQDFFKKSNQSLILKVDLPYFTVLAVSDTYLELLRTERSKILNNDIFYVFPGSQVDPSEKHNVISSFMRVIKYKTKDEMPVFKYEIVAKDTGKPETFYWSNINEPILDDDGNVAYLVNTTANITTQVLQEQIAAKSKQFAAALDREQIANEELTASNEQLYITNQELQQTQANLSSLNKELEERVASRTKHLEQIIDEKNSLEITLLENQQRLQSILDTMAEGVAIVDVHGNVVYANLLAQRILGIDNNDIGNITFFGESKWQNMRIDGSPLPEADHPIAVMIATGMAIYDQEIAVQRIGGEIFYISINAAPLLDQEGKLTGGIGTFMDVTNRRRLMQQKDEFISIASHELKTPVTSLKASLQLLDRMKDNPAPEILKKLIAQSNRSLEKLNSLVSDLLNVNRIAQGQLRLNKTWFTLAEMINDCCNHVRTAGTHEISLEGDIDVRIYADEHQLDQVLINFVNNSVKYAPNSKHIRIKIEKKATFIRVSVTDNGPGISAELLPHIFNRYYRADYSGVQFSGLGLGLYINSEIIKRHGGEIGVNSDLGKGSTFWFTLPSD